MFPEVLLLKVIFDFIIEKVICNDGQNNSTFVVFTMWDWELMAK